MITEKFAFIANLVYILQQIFFLGINIEPL